MLTVETVCDGAELFQQTTALHGGTHAEQVDRVLRELQVDIQIQLRGEGGEEMRRRT